MPFKKILLVLSLLSLVQLPAFSDPDPLVNIQEINPEIKLDIRYATDNNFLHKPFYQEAACFLHQSVAESLSRVQEEVSKSGFDLKVFDCYRPLAVQKAFWQQMPDERYVANPAKGSRHNRGAAVDLTLVRKDGSLVEMPTEYDDFTVKAHRNYKNLSEKSLSNSLFLEKSMKKHGFDGLSTEWWHFDYQGWQKYPIMDINFSEINQKSKGFAESDH